MMKKYVMLLAALVVSSAAIAADGGIAWEKGTLAQAIEKASNENKMVFVDCFTTWCGPCKRMSGEEFVKKEAGDYFNEKFVNIAIDMEKGEGLDVAKEYGIRQYPTFLILSPEGKLITKVIGGAKIDEFIQRVEKALQEAGSSAWVSYSRDVYRHGPHHGRRSSCCHDRY